MKRQVRVFGRTIPLLIPIVVALMIGSFAIGSYIYDTRMLSMTASIKTVGEFSVYKDEACTVLAEMNDWGEFDILGGDDFNLLPLWIKSEANAPLEITWTISGESWTINGLSKYSLYYPALADPQWRFDGIRNLDTSGTWWPEDSTDPNANHVLNLNVGEVRAVRFRLNAFQSDGVYADLSFQLRLTAWDTYS